jgi:hypothetical protein
MTEPNLLKLAKKGNAKALTAILNQSLQPQNITAKVNRKDDYLQILLESVQTPDQEAMVSFIRKGLIKLEIESIQTVKVYGRKTGEESPAWSKKIELVSPPETPSITEPIDSENLSSYQTFRTPKSSVTPKVDDPPSTESTDFQNPRRSSAMSTNPNSRPAIGPMSVGNVVSAAFVLYRSHLKTYLQLALTAYLWTFIPIYGWAKYTAIAGMISRLAFGELTSQPESVSSARRYVNQRLWSFLRVAFQVGLLLLGIYLGLFIVFALTVFLLGVGLGFVLNSLFKNPVVAAILLGIITILGVVGFLFPLIWFVSRWLIAEVPLAVEESINGAQSVARSWELSKNHVRRIQGVVMVAFLVSFPIVMLTSYVPQIFLIQLEPGSSLYWIVYFISLGTSLVGGVFVLPFWQAIKAVLYYDLRSRREGLDLQRRDLM